MTMRVWVVPASLNVQHIDEPKDGVQLSFFQLDDPVLTQIRDEILGLGCQQSHSGRGIEQAQRHQEDPAGKIISHSCSSGRSWQEGSVMTSELLRK